MTNQEQLKLINKGYGLAHYLPDEFEKAIKDKLEELSHNSKDKEKWKSWAKGFEMALMERAQDRKKEIAKIKKGRTPSKGRTR